LNEILRQPVVYLLTQQRDGQLRSTSTKRKQTEIEDKWQWLKQKKQGNQNIYINVSRVKLKINKLF
jgi:hypothetical protein